MKCLLFLLLIMFICGQTSYANNDRDLAWWSVALIGSSIYDVETTFAAMGSGSEYREANILMKPFVDSRKEAYLVQMSINGALIYVAYRNKDKEYWWLPLAAAVAAHATAGTWNVRYVW